MTTSFQLTRKSLRNAVSLAALVFVLMLVITGHGQAANTGPIGLQISPVTLDINVDPGQVYNFKISAFNITDSSLELTPAINDFKAKDETGTPAIQLDGSEPPSSSVKSWLSLSDSKQFSLASKTTKPIIVKLAVPKNAEAGGHYGVVRFIGAGTGQDQVSLNASWGTLVLVRVSGDIKEQLSVDEFFTTRSGKKTSLFEKGPIGFSERINNSGNVHVKPKGNIIITNLLGKQVGSVAINAEGGNILPNSTRRFSQTFNKSRMFGRYTAKFNLAYGTQGKTVSDSLTFWVIPYKIITAVIFLIILVVWLGRRGLKRYNKKVIQKAQRRS